MCVRICHKNVLHSVPSERRKHGGVSTFSFPVKDPERCKKWVQAIKNLKYNDNTPLKELQTERVCSLHFKPEEIDSGELKQRLLGGKRPNPVLSTTAVPSINLDDFSQVNVVGLPGATKDASPHVPRTAHEKYEATILSLFKRCQICGCPISSTEVHYVRGKMCVRWDCFGGHAGTWRSFLRVKTPEDLSDEEENMLVSEDGSDSNWEPLENSADSMYTDSDSDTDEIDEDEKDDAVGLKLHQLCPECGKLINIQKAHTCEHKLKQYLCNVCGKRFLSEHNLKVHGRVHKEGYKHECKFCLKTFTTRAHKLAHEQSHPRVKKPYQCPDCPEVFAQIQARCDHLRNHRGPQQYICQICNMEFAYSNALERHVVTHTGEKQFACEVCQRSFSQASHLKSHMRIHTGEKPYQCQHCDECFTHNISLKSHIQRYHERILEETTTNQSEAEKNEMNQMENNAVDRRQTHGETLRRRGRKKRRLCATINNRKKKQLTGRPKGRPQINSMIASDVTDKLKFCDGDENDESWSYSDSSSDSAEEDVTWRSKGRPKNSEVS